MSTALLRPTESKERILVLDILRGLAILGIFIMNLEGFTFYWALNDVQKAVVPLARYDHAVEFLQLMLLEGKFYSIFSLLFGIGFAIYLAKSLQNASILPLFRRRLAVLLLIGFLHLLLWSGDIVAFYAMLGFVLIPFRNFSNKALLITAACCILSPIGWYALKMSNPAIFDLSQWPFKWGNYLSEKQGIKSGQDFYNAMKTANLLEVIKMNLAGIFFRYSDLIFQSRGFKVFGMFLIGLVIGRTQLYHKMNVHRKLLWFILIGGLAIGLPANFLMVKYKATQGYYQLKPDGLKQTIAYAFGVAPLALAYTSMFALLYMNNFFKKIFNVLAPVGKMALSNYIMHTVIGTLAFTGVGLALDPIGPAAWTIFALAVFIFQIITSIIWLHYFHYGPLEWLWRSATYKKWQPMLRSKKEGYSL